MSTMELPALAPVQATESFDAIIIGSGQAGKPLAIELGRAGWKTALIEREHVGGTCINVGCTPTKTMVASARVAYLARRADDYGVRVLSVSVDLAAVRARKRAIVERFRNYITGKLQQTENLSLLFGGVVRRRDDGRRKTERWRNATLERAQHCHQYGRTAACAADTRA
jgi:pyruvate/2-oxoglutarate dehydrogenase complex dihydrolipoamide dehydrogenase (E3) component